MLLSVICLLPSWRRFRSGRLFPLVSQQPFWAAHGHRTGSSSDTVVLKMSHTVGKSAGRFLYDSQFSWKRWIKLVQEAFLRLPPFSSSKSILIHPQLQMTNRPILMHNPITDQLIQLQLFTLRFCCGIAGHTELNTGFKFPKEICKWVTKPQVQADEQSAASSPASWDSLP